MDRHQQQQQYRKKQTTINLTYISLNENVYFFAQQFKRNFFVQDLDEIW